MKTTLRTRAALMVSTLAVSVFTYAADLSELNAAIAEILAHFNNDNSVVSLNVSKANVNEQRAVGFAAKALVKKTGPKAEGQLSADLDYSYPEKDGAKPEFSVGLALTAANGNLAKIFANFGVSLSEINEFFAGAEEQISKYLAEAQKEYGKALTFSLIVSTPVEDENGNFLSARVALNVNLDPSKLPEGVDVKELYFLGLQVNLGVNMLTGASASGKVHMNPEHSSFNEDGRGLKEVIEALLNKDTNALQDLAMFAEFANNFMNTAVGLEE